VPEIVGDITWAEASFQSVHGEIRSSWEISDNSFSLTVNIPANCEATIAIPQTDPDKISENGVQVKISESVRVEMISNGRTLLKTGSGEYSFKCQL
jgi:alpha-L-rhamnosidase